MTEKLQLSKSDRQKVWWRSTFLQGSWNYERMQNLGWAYSLIPAIKKLYTKKEDQAAALERHMEFFNTHPYVAAPIIGVTLALEAMPAWLSDGMQIGGGMVVAVGYAMVINMMASREVWPFFAIGFALAAVSQLTLIALGAIGVALALIYLTLSKKGGNGGGGAATSNDPIGDILEDY